MSDNLPEIRALRRWSIGTVRGACIRNNLYSMGDAREYENMLSIVRDTENHPTYETIYAVAKDICNHSEQQTVTNIMYILEQEAVITTFELDGMDNR